MWARVTTAVAGEASRFDDVVQMINSENIPRMKELGASGGYWMMNRNDGRVVAVTLFETEQALRDSEAAVAALRERAGQKMGGTIQSVDVFEVIGQL